MTAAQIYEQITGGEGTGSLADAHDSATQLTARMVERAQRISSLRAKTMSGWQGGAGNSAADATLPLVQAAADDAVHLETAQTAVGAQMDAFGTAKNSVKPVPPQPPEITPVDVLHAINGDGVGSYQTKVAGWQADSQANIDAFSAYHSASGTNGGQMPAQYAQLADSGAPVGLTPRDDAGRKAGPTDTGEWARNPRQPQVPAQQSRQTVQPGQNQVQNQNLTQNQNQNQFQNQVQQPNNPDSTHANSYVPNPVMLPSAQGGYQFGPTGQFGSEPGGNAFGPGTGGYSGGSFGPGTGGYGTNPGTGTGYRPGATPGAGVRSPGPSTGARMPEERLPGATTRGTPGARGANGMPMGAPGGGRGGKDEDKEKKSAAYLRNPDPDETFGGFIEKPMPPVIGENRPKNQ
ncbi:PPE domain-containing protein [Amycolatopsis sp. RTGN1]|uniref:PPE domain-containing protein n=1 Tax=Amycolatopsis ponsaeliensis TaxID=2992142 RepID=UPI00254F548E|nr:PPE domain-containing protein [Amycolatopsis sp. RTGN1]